jgi:hypothetical protein
VAAKLDGGISRVDHYLNGLQGYIDQNLALYVTLNPDYSRVGVIKQKWRL